jgi:hypothetical protein
MNKELDDMSEKVNCTIEKMYKILGEANLPKAYGIAILEGMKLDIMLNEGIVTLDGIRKKRKKVGVKPDIPKGD